jgi:DNA polymerase III sliding clamp (beta) subunit (PCNA family)
VIPFSIRNCIAEMVYHHSFRILQKGKKSTQLIKKYRDETTEHKKYNKINLKNLICIASSKSAPQSVAIPRIKSDAEESTANIRSCPASTNSRILF